jgi:lipid-A-disaccharide synthase-like uncharacterized protein
MHWISNWLWINDKFLGIEWGVWKIIGWVGNLVFFSRFFVQWVATEKHKRVVVPDAFWYLSLGGSVCLLTYSFHQKDSVFIFAYLFTWIPYIRSLIISHRVAKAVVRCSGCRTSCPAKANFCPECGLKLRLDPARV